MTAAVPASPTLTAPATLLDLIDRSRVRDVVAIVGFALFTALAAQITIPLGFTPVPITGQTFAVLLAGGVLGANRGALSMGLYVALGA
ncbi:MAG TPA: biotin transporter BioY, partial [Ilumatobacteraceae bacterium]|nr:biotin transporter BioY [Ilumatobacteraceae bacterium]